MEIDPATLSGREAYQLMIGAIIPRPIAFVTTVSPDGLTNLAPFSFFNGVAASPPIVTLAIGRRAGERKDTARNILETGELVINAATVALAEAVNLAAGDWPAGTSEVEVCGLATRPSAVVRPPRLEASPIHLECTLHQAIEVEATSALLVLARVLRYHVDDALLDARGRIDPRRLDPLARLGGDGYARLGELLTMQRPRVDRATGARSDPA